MKNGVAEGVGSDPHDTNKSGLSFFISNFFTNNKIEGTLILKLTMGKRLKVKIIHPKNSSYPKICLSRKCVIYLEISSFPKIRHSRKVINSENSSFSKIRHSRKFVILENLSFPKIRHSRKFVIPENSSFPKICHSRKFIILPKYIP